MTLYLTGVSNADVVAAAQTQRQLGVLAQPGNALHRTGPSFSAWGIDNGGFGMALRGQAWTPQLVDTYLAYLAKVQREVDTSSTLFATAPDVLHVVDGQLIGDATATWEQSLPTFDRIRAAGFKAALVAQDGLETFDHPTFDWDAFDVLFLGGSTEWKTGAGAAHVTQLAKARGKWVHMGRVNSYKRLRIAQLMGCDSADGTFIGFGPRVNLPRVLGWFDKLAAA